MKLISAIALMFFYMNIITPQEVNTKWGSISMESLKMTEYPKDKEAEALILFDLGESYFIDYNNGYNVRYTRRKRVKVFKENGVSHAEIEIPLYQGKTEREKLISVEAMSYNLDGTSYKRSILKASEVFEETINKYWKIHKFAIPNVKEGTVFEFKYVVDSPFLFNLPDWTFQSNIPTKLSKYKVTMIPFYEYVFIAQGIKAFDIQTTQLAKNKRTYGTVTKNYGRKSGRGVEFQEVTYEYGKKDIPAFRDETFISSVSDYIMKMDFQLSKVTQTTGASEEIISTWPKMIKELSSHKKFGKYISKSKKHSKNYLKSIQSEIPSDKKEAVRFIIDQIKSTYKWNGDLSYYADVEPKNLEKTKSGNKAAINLFLISVLNEYGVDAKPIISSTRNHGAVSTDYPFYHYFNNVVALVKLEGTSFMCDASSEMTAFNRIPYTDMNSGGLLIDKNEAEPQWINMQNGNLSETKNFFTMTLALGKASAQVKSIRLTTESDAFHDRRTLKNEEEKVKEKYIEKGLLTVDNVVIKNFENKYKPYTLVVEGSTEIDQIDNELYILPFLKFPIQKNPFTTKKRNYPVDVIYPHVVTYTSNIALSEGMTAGDLPENYSISDKQMDITITYEKKEKVIITTASYKFKESMYEPNVYYKIKKHMEEITTRFNEPIQILLQE